MPGKTNLKIYKGATFRHVFIWKDGDEVPLNITGYTARMQVRKKIDDVATLLELTTENGGITITPLEGKIALYVSAEATAALTWVDGVYDLEMIIQIDGVDDVTRLVEGKVTVFKEVTR